MAWNKESDVDSIPFIQGQHRAARLLKQLHRTCGTGDEVFECLSAFLGPLHPHVADQMCGFARVVQKRIEQGSSTVNREAR